MLATRTGVVRCCRQDRLVVCDGLLPPLHALQRDTPVGRIQCHTRCLTPFRGSQSQCSLHRPLSLAAVLPSAPPVEHRVDGPGAQLDRLVEAPQRLLQLALPCERVAAVAQRPAHFHWVLSVGYDQDFHEAALGLVSRLHLPTMSGTQSAFTSRYVSISSVQSASSCCTVSALSACCSIFAAARS